MTTKERVLAYFREWADMGVNIENGCHIRYIDDPFGDDGVMAWEVCMKHSRAFIVYDDETYQCDEDFEIAARILGLHNPWRLTSEELPEVDVAVWGAWKDMLVLNETMPCVYRGNGEWASNEYREGNLNPPDCWMCIQSPW